MQTLPESKNTIAQIAEAADTFSKVVEGVTLEKVDAKAATDIDSLLKLARLFVESTMT